MTAYRLVTMGELTTMAEGMADVLAYSGRLYSDGDVNRDGRPYDQTALQRATAALRNTAAKLAGETPAKAARETKEGMVDAVAKRVTPSSVMIRAVSNETYRKAMIDRGYVIQPIPNANAQVVLARVGDAVMPTEESLARAAVQRKNARDIKATFNRAAQWEVASAERVQIEG